MASPLPPDPYAALGVSKDCDQSVIKATYKKLVLKTHPDKFTDETVKKQKQEEFHKIQEAYEIIGDEEKRAQYDAERKLQELRRERFSKPGSGGTRVEVHKTHYDIRTAAPSDPSFPQPRFEERKPTRAASYEEDRYHEDRSSSRKYDTYDSYPRRSPPRSSREKEPVKVTRVATDRSRSDKNKSRDKDDRRERSAKYFTVDDDISSADDKARFESATRQRERERRRLEEEDRIRKEAEAARRKAEKGRSTEDMRKADRERKYSEHLEHATNYISRHATAEVRPSPGRSSSSREPEHYSRRGSDAPRRSSARPKESGRPTSSGRDRDRKGLFPEIVEWDHESERKIPSLKPSASSPPEIPGARIQIPPQRSYTTEGGNDRRRREVSPTQFLRRAETMPTVHTSSSSRRKEPLSSRVHDSGYSAATTPETIYPTIPGATKKYYTTSGGGVRLVPDEVEVANGHQAVRREPRHDSDRHRTRSPSPLGRPPIGANRPIPPIGAGRVIAPKYVPAAPQPPRTTTIVPPPLGRSATMGVPSDRDRGRKFFGEIDPDYPTRGRQGSIDPAKVVYAHRIGRDDIRYSPMETKGDDYFRTMRKPEGYVY